RVERPDEREPEREHSAAERRHPDAGDAAAAARALPEPRDAGRVERREQRERHEHPRIERVCMREIAEAVHSRAVAERLERRAGNGGRGASQKSAGRVHALPRLSHASTRNTPTPLHSDAIRKRPACSSAPYARNVPWPCTWPSASSSSRSIRRQARKEATPAAAIPAATATVTSTSTRRGRSEPPTRSCRDSWRIPRLAASRSRRN